jgi:hypothetical protein
LATNSNAWATAKAVIRPFLPTEFRGAWDYHRHPESRDSWGGPCNGQQARQALVQEIIKAIDPALIIETGTYRGTTTAFLRDISSAPVITVENSRWFWGYAAYRFLGDPKVSVRRGDSPVVLRSLLRNKRLAGATAFFYLDAHWGHDLPLREELEVIFSSDVRAIVMIDDFQVPDDPGYAYDDYGPSKALTLEYTQSVSEMFGLDLYFPSVPSLKETGGRTGCVVMAERDSEARVLAALPGLRRLDSRL